MNILDFGWYVYACALVSELSEIAPATHAAPWKRVVKGSVCIVEDEAFAEGECLQIDVETSRLCTSVSGTMQAYVMQFLCLYI